MKINIGNHEFTELWDGVLYKALSDYPNVSDNEMKDITMVFLPVKVKDEVKLANYVHMIVIPSEYKDQIMKVMPEQLSDSSVLPES